MTYIDIKVGSVVALRSGGQIMTVENMIPYTKQCVCIWHNTAGDLRLGVFAVAVLEALK